MRVQGCDAVQVAVLLSEVQTVTDHELGLDVPANILDVDVSLDDLGLAEEGANLNRLRRREKSGSAATRPGSDRSR